MKKLLKQTLGVILTLTLVVSAFSMCFIVISAAEIGTTPTNAIKLTKDKWYTRYWTNENYDAKCYNKIDVPSRGYIEFIIEKPVDTEGEICTYDLNLYDSNGTIIWTGNKSAKNDIFNEYYTYKIGLKAGTYYMDINPSFYIFSYSAPIKTKYRFKFTKSSNWEVESNNDFKTATTISLNEKYTGILDEDINAADYFKIKLTKNNKYTITFNNYSSDITYKFYDSNQSSQSFSTEDSNWYYGKKSLKNNKLTLSFTSQQTGYHYIYLGKLWPDVDYQYTVKVTPQKIDGSKTKIKLSDTSYTYNGKSKKPSVKVYYDGEKVSSKNYTVSYAEGRKNVGKYKVTVNFKGDFKGKNTAYFTINPPKTTVSKLTAAKKSLKVKIKKQSKQTSGYEIQYSLKKNFKSAKSKTTTKTSYTIKSLKAKKTYYVRVRTYKKVNGKKYYSSWSAYKYKKTK